MTSSNNKRFVILANIVIAPGVICLFLITAIAIAFIWPLGFSRECLWVNSFCKFAYAAALVTYLSLSILFTAKKDPFRLILVQSVIVLALIGIVIATDITSKQCTPDNSFSLP